MKKLVSILVALSMVLLAVTAFAAANPLENAPIYVIDTFDKIQGDDDAEITSGEWTDEKGTAVWMDYNYTSATLKLDNGKLKVLNGDGALNFRVALFGTEPAQEALAGKNFDGIGYYMENNTAAAAEIGSYCVADGAWLFQYNEEVILLSTNGTATVAEVGNATEWGGGTFVVPAGFKGYVLVPNANLANAWAGGAIFVAGTDKVGNFGLQIGAIEIGEGESLVFDNYFAYGGNIENNNNGLITWGSNSGEEPTETGDFSVIAYAAATVLGLGGLTVIRRKK